MSLVTLEQRGHVGLITLNRPKSLNAINIELLHRFNHILDEVETCKDVFALVVTGAGRAFSSGADVAEMANFSATEAERFSRVGSGLVMRLSRFPLPVIAAVNGYAMGGGCELAMGCDIRLGSEDAKFSLPEVSLGVMPGFGGTQFMQRIVGMSTAMELVLTGRTIDAQEALSIGLITHLTPRDQILDQAMALADLIASKPQIAVRQAKQAIRTGRQVDMYSATALESHAFGLCFSTEDQKNAMRVFLDREGASNHQKQ